MKLFVVAIWLIVLSGCIIRLPACGGTFYGAPGLNGSTKDLHFSCSVEPQRNVNRCAVHDLNEKTVCRRDFRLQPGNRYLRYDEFQSFSSFDGEAIHLRGKNGQELKLLPLMPCKLED